MAIFPTHYQQSHINHLPGAAVHNPKPYPNKYLPLCTTFASFVLPIPRPRLIFAPPLNLHFTSFLHYPFHFCTTPSFALPLHFCTTPSLLHYPFTFALPLPFLHYPFNFFTTSFTFALPLPFWGVILFSKVFV